MAIFHGPHAYVSAQWYDPQNVASIWNYMTVHARGKMKFLDEQALIDFLGRLTDHFEGVQDSPAALAKMDSQYVQQMAKAIVAFEMQVTELAHVFKLSQNKPEVVRQNIIGHLEKGDAANMCTAKKMRNAASNIPLIHQLFDHQSATTSTFLVVGRLALRMAICLTAAAAKSITAFLL